MKVKQEVPVGAFLQKWTTPEGVMALVGALWFLLSSIFPAIPASMPVPPYIPGLDAITPGLLCLGVIASALIRQAVPGKTMFVNNTEVPK